MTSRPILFSAPMVRAILAGRKTQTRLVVKPQPLPNLPFVGMKGDEARWAVYLGGDVSVDSEVRCPYGGPGDELWVRETWRPGRHSRHAFYRATDDDGAVAKVWRPSIHMPRWASRLTLRVTGVRVERLQAISEEDAVAEGVERVWRDVPPAMGGGVEPRRDYLDEERWCASASDSYRTLWESINGPGSWARNPWVWVVSFEVRP